MSGPYDRGGWDNEGGWPGEQGSARDDRRGPSGGRWGDDNSKRGGSGAAWRDAGRGREGWRDSSGGYDGGQSREGYGRDPYGRPASSSGRRYGADEPTRPSSDWDAGGGYGYGQPEADTWGKYTRSNTHWRGGAGPVGYRNIPEGAAGPNSMPRNKQYGVPWGPEQRWDMVPALPKKRSRRKLWVTLCVIAAVLILACSGIGFVAVQFFAPAFQVGLFCGSLQTQRYATGYTLLSTELRNQLSSNDFVTDGQTLDAIEGVVQKCGTGSYSFSVGASTATVAVSFTRATAGTLQGNIHLKNENGWKVDRLDASLLGVSLGALQTATAYCAALQVASYTAAYALLGKSLTAHTTAVQYAQESGWHDTLDGPVSECAVTALGSANSETETAASMTLSITRGKLGAKKDTVALDVEGGAWKVSTLGPGLQGSDLGALDTATRFCADIKSASYTDLYGLLSDNAKGGSSEADFASVFSGNYNGIKWDDCAPTVSSFKLSGDSATLSATLTVTNLNTNQTRSGPVSFSFARNNGAWLLDNLQA
jgi:hypothetical protein